MADYQTVNYPVARPSTLRTGRSEWLQNWLDGNSPDLTFWEQQGFQPHLYYAVVIYKSNTNTINGTQFAALLHVEAARRGISGPVMAFGDHAVLFHPVEDPQQTARLKLKTGEIREQLVARMYVTDVCCGVGRPAQGTDALRQSFHEAQEAVQMCEDLHSKSRATFFGNSSLFSLLLSLKSPSEDLQRFCATWLSDIMTYDETQHSDLLDTLNTYFANNGNTALTAKELKIHRNTLAYRLNRIAEITHLDLDDADVRLNLHLALKALTVIGSPQVAH